MEEKKKQILIVEAKPPKLDKRFRRPHPDFARSPAALGSRPYNLPMPYKTLGVSPGSVYDGKSGLDKERHRPDAEMPEMRNTLVLNPRIPPKQTITAANIIIM